MDNSPAPTTTVPIQTTVPPVVTVASPVVSEKTSNDGKILVNRRPDGTILPGVVLNPEGKKAGTRHMTTLLRDAIVKIDEGEAEPSDIMIVKTVLKQARRGDSHAQDLVFDRLDGKAPQTLIHEGDGLGGLTTEQKLKLNALLGIVPEIAPEVLQNGTIGKVEEITTEPIPVAIEPPKVEEQPAKIE